MENQKASTGYFCSNCQFNIQEEKEYKLHYKSDFHRYNIKRKLLELQPASYEQFEKQTAEKQSIQPEEAAIKCITCNKIFASKNTYKQHLESKKHLIEEENKKNKVISEKKEISTPVETTLNNLSICLFCNELSESIEKNVEHMRRKHSFFVIEEEFITNLSGLLKYLAEKINIGLLCIYCDNRGFKVADAVRNHMIDKGHCFMNSDFFEEYEKYYDFSKEFEKLIKENELAGKNVNGLIRNIEVDSDGNENDEWKDEDDEENNEEGFEKKIKSKPQTFKIRKAKLLDTGEIKLPNGKILGNRIYKFLYRQRYVPLPYKSRQYKALLGSNYESRELAIIGQQKQLMLAEKYLQLKQSKERHKYNKKECELFNYHFLHLGVQANHLQHHFRKQVP